MSAFVQSLHEVFEGMGRIQARRMFGGHGIYHEGRMFALVVRETLYLKADAQTAGFFDALDLPAFSYERQGRITAMSYRQAPADVFEDRSEAALWGRRAWEAALRSGKPPKPGRAAPPSSRQSAGRST
ncbi:transcriptional regulator [Rhodoferax koreense]|uniref:Transcriptional regulator n=1 Tax=Rhodoferax koreensis TaxID=1842727 RepID=A0A1P8JXV9_9BURK|nr:TfoX/Sxy family protein [Rhodoferax koreense]APW38575.1 transcriptional regulator [Rhodoferax koreense]